MICSRCQFENPQDTKFCGQCGAPLAQPEQTLVAQSTETLSSPAIRELVPGTTFARRYQVIEELGHGGMGRVYKVHDTEVREKLALKLLNPDIAADGPTIERFRNELKLARTISHRNICRMHDLGREENSYYITMEYVPGEDLKSFIHRVGALPVAKAVAVARQVCEGLEEAHRVGVVHRDLKPQNIMIDREGNARIMDFGIARSVRTRGITGANVMIGTPEYMSPEQVEGKETDGRSDLYSLGVVLFEMLTGRLPFEGETPLAVAVQQKSEPAPDPSRLNPQIPEDLRRAVLKCLEKSKDRRYQTAGELGTDLARIEKSLPKTTKPLPVRAPSTSKSITVRLPPRKFWIPAAAVAVAVAAFLVWQFIPQRAASRRSIAVMGFKNQTGDRSFDYLQETIPNLLITSLEQSGHFRVTSWQQLKDLIGQTGKDASAVLDEEAGFDVCRREGIEALVVGFYTKAGETFVTDVKVLDASTKQPLKTAQARGEGPASILRTQIDEISRTVARGVGLPVLKIEKALPKVADLTTTSLEAYSDFLHGRDAYSRFLFDEARRSLEQAVKLDPTFAIAYLYLANTYADLADFKARDEALKKAQEFAGRATEKEKLQIAARYASIIDHNPVRSRELLIELTAKYPSEKYAHFDLGLSYHNPRDYPQAAAEYEKAIALDPNFGYAINQLAYVYAQKGDMAKAIQYFDRYAAINPGDPNPKDSIAELYLRMGKLDESAAKYQEILAARPDFYISWASLSCVRVLQENYPEADRCIEGFIAHAPTPSAQIEAHWVKSYFEYFEGRWRTALADFLAIRKQVEKAGVPYMVAVTDWITGFIYCDLGEFDKARVAFKSLVDWAKSTTPQAQRFYAAGGPFYQGWVDVKQGRLDDAEKVVKEIEPILPMVSEGDRDVMFNLFYLLAAETALARDSVDEAIAFGEKWKPQPLPAIRTPNIASYNVPFVKDVLARAYWKKGDLDRAAAEYAKLMTIDPSNQVRYFIHPLYHYRMGLVLEQKGDRAGARAQYAKFLECWKDADPTHPEPGDARRRLATLRPN